MYHLTLDSRREQRLIWTGHLAISDSSEPNRAAVEDWLCDITQWIDTTLAWRYAVPVTDARDRELLRPICAALAAARCWTVLVASVRRTRTYRPYGVIRRLAKVDARECPEKWQSRWPGRSIR